MPTPCVSTQCVAGRRLAAPLVFRWLLVVTILIGLPVAAAAGGKSGATPGRSAGATATPTTGQVAVRAVAAATGPATIAPPADATSSVRPNYLKINIYGMMSPSIEEQVREVSDALAAEVNLITFARRGFPIHATLYLTVFEPERVPEILTTVASLAAELRPIPVRTTGFKVTPDFWLFLDLARDLPLQRLANRVTRRLMPLRAKSDYVPGWVKSYPQKVKYCALAGSPNVFSQFEPHLTLLAPSDPSPTMGESAPLPPPWRRETPVSRSATGPSLLEDFVRRHREAGLSSHDCSVPHHGHLIGLGVGIADRNGQITEVLGEFRFR